MATRDLPLVFVTGMFRSGTTLLARLLGAHPEVAFASDPFAPLFKAFRNSVAERLFGGDAVDPQAPLCLNEIWEIVSCAYC